MMPYPGFLTRLKPVKGHFRKMSSPSAQRKPMDDESQNHTKQEKQKAGNRQQVVQLRRISGYFRTLKWTPIPLSVGFSLLAYQHYKRVTKRTVDLSNPHSGGVALAEEWEVTSYRMVPLKAFSRLWGWVHNIYLPVWARTPFFTWYKFQLNERYAETFHCNLSEAEVEDLEQYQNLGEFFRRSLKQGVRPICNKSAMVSPVDGTVLNYGEVKCGNVEQVKGVSYSLPTFLGPPTWKSKSNLQSSQSAENTVDKQQYCNELRKNKDTSLFHCVLYLAPGDYHRFHSPVQWTAYFRRHFSGELLSVNPIIASRLRDLFSLNERVVYVGEWEHGFFSYAAIGATNVGSIKVYEDKDLTTNCRGVKKNTYRDKPFRASFEKGDSFGEFNLGSTIVLIFEAPSDFQFAAQVGSKVHVGQSLFTSSDSRRGQSMKA